MNLNLRKELPNILLVLLPYAYLVSIYGQLPEEVPTHFDINGNINGWSSKASLWFIPAALPFIIYGVFLLIPLIDPKQKLKSGVGKYEQLKFVMLLFIAAISCFVLFISLKGTIAGMESLLFALIGLLLAAMGNFFPSLRPNYFMGIRSPWTLENETVWRKTHQMAGRLWVLGGIIIAATALIYGDHKNASLFFLSMMILLTILPFLYSFVIWKKLSIQKP